MPKRDDAESRYPLTRRYVVHIARTLDRVDKGHADQADGAALDELEEYFGGLDDAVQEARVTTMLHQVAREEMKRQGGEELRPDLRLVRNED